jgi:DNA-binding protein Fis
MDRDSTFASSAVSKLRNINLVENYTIKDHVKPSLLEYFMSLQEYCSPAASDLTAVILTNLEEFF